MVRLFSRRGFTLIEVLVALCVVSIGLGGAALLHVRSQRAALDAARLLDAVQLAASLGERMRANPAAMALDDALNPYLQLDFDAADGPVDDATADCYADAGCTPDALARFDLRETMLAVAGGFPGGRIVACRDGGALAWECDGLAGAPIVIKLGWRGADGAALPMVVLPVGLP